MTEVTFEVAGDRVAGSWRTPPPGVATKGTLLFVHGFLSNRLEFMDAPARLAERGYRTLAFDQRGFGSSGGARGVVAHRRTADDVKAAIRWLAAQGAADRLGLVGHSMGAAFAVFSATECPEVKSLGLVAPLNRVRDELGSAEFKMYQVANALSRAKTRMGFGPLLVPYKNRYRDLYVDPEAAKRAEGIAYLDKSVSLGNYDALLAIHGAEWAKRVRQSALVVLCRHDKAVQNGNSRAVYDALAGPKELVEIDSGHSAWGDRAAKELLERLDAHFAKTL